jgi:two-component system NtrC family response regulator
MGQVLIIDDDRPIRDALSRVVENLGHAPQTAGTLADGVAKARQGSFDVVLLDVRLPDGNGLDAIADLQAAPSRPEVIVITGWGDPDGAEAAMRRGAWDYIEKPPTLRSMTAPLASAMAYRGSRPAEAGEGFAWEGLPGAHPGRAACLEQAAKAAKSDASVLIMGETGTGKELFARAIHRNSPRKDGPFVAVDCAALPASIAESVLFGSERGAYTGADRARDGLILKAHGGSLFLDEVGELPPSVQKTFLRTLQERAVRPVGATSERNCDFRLVAATHRDLDSMALAGAFREDLLFRLRGMVIHLPPLREHPEDVGTFARHFLGLARKRHPGAPARLSPAVLALMAAYPWPGNVRELQNAVDGMAAMAPGEPELHPVHLPLHIRVQVARGQVRDKEEPAAPTQPAESGAPLPGLKAYRQAMDRLYLEQLLARSGGKAARACEMSGMSRSRLYALLRAHGMKMPG